MAVIQKRADELKPGDVIIGEKGGEQVKSSVIWTKPAPHGLCTVFFMRLGGEEEGSRKSVENHLEESDFDVEVSGLTLAQQHAEELAEFVEMIERGASGESTRAAARNLLAKIKPPEPPTLAEALVLIQRMQDIDAHPNSGEVDALLDRARRAKLI